MVLTYQFSKRMRHKQQIHMEVAPGATFESLTIWKF